MSTAKHTAEPWYINATSPDRVESMSGEVLRDLAMRRENALRIVRCVNALARINDPEGALATVRNFLALAQLNGGASDANDRERALGADARNALAALNDTP